MALQPWERAGGVAVCGADGCALASGVDCLVYSGCALLRMVDHFSLSLKFKSGAMRRIYHRGKISYHAFLTIMGFVVRSDSQVRSSIGSVSVPSLVGCLGRTRRCFLSFYLPAVHHGLVRTVSYSARGRITFLVLGFFSRCTKRIHGRVSCRSVGIFACMRGLVAKQRAKKFHVSRFTHERSRVSTALARLGGVVVGCCPTGKGGRLLGTMLFSVFDYRRSLTSRYHMRSCLFIPTMLELRGRKG